MSKKKTNIKMRPRLVTAIASGFMILSTLLCCTYIIVNHYEAKKLAQLQEENQRKQAIASNTNFGESNEGILPETQNNASSPTTEAALTRRRLLVGSMEERLWQVCQTHGT